MPSLLCTCIRHSFCKPYRKHVVALLIDVIVLGLDVELAEEVEGDHGVDVDDNRQQ